jgi:hypothetical protein
VNIILSKVVAAIQRTTRRHIPEEDTLHHQYRFGATVRFELWSPGHQSCINLYEQPLKTVVYFLLAYLTYFEKIE